MGNVHSCLLSCGGFVDQTIADPAKFGTIPEMDWELRSEALREYVQHHTQAIEDITPQIHEQARHVRANKYDRLMIPVQRAYKPAPTGSPFPGDAVT